MLVSDIYRKIRGSKLYHYTVASNMNSIGFTKTIYSTDELNRLGIERENITNDLSHDLDISRGLSSFVFLTFSEKHPMIYKLREKGIKLIGIEIDISVLDITGVIISDKIANSNGANFFTPEKALEVLDIQNTHNGYIYDSSTWNIAKEYEILVPNSIDLQKYGVK